MKASLFFSSLLIITLFSCGKYKEFDHLEVLDQSFTGAVSINESAGNVSGVYSGDKDHGTYTFIWENPSRWVEFEVDNTMATGGSVQFILKDSRGREIMNKTLTPGYSYAITQMGKKGKWKLSLVFSDFEGIGTFDLKPAK